MAYLYLAIAIISEVIATSTLKATKEFTKFWPSIVVALAYGSAFYFLTITLRTIPVGISYAIWSGVGTVLITILGAVLYKQFLDLPAILGIILIVSGVVVINVFSITSRH